MGDGVKVDPGALVDYSEQLGAISENALGTIKKYASDNLEITDELQVALVIAMPTTPTWATLDMQKDVSQQVAKYVADLMSKLGDTLYEAARNYKKGESEGSAKILKVWGEGVPDDFEEEPHRKGDTNWDGSDLKLTVPHWHKRAPDALKLINESFGDVGGIPIEDVINYIVGLWEPGFDVMKWLKEVIPDWGELEGLGAQHGELQDAYNKIRTEIEDGMDYLGSHWDGPAAGAFEFHVRKHWLDGLETIADLHRTLKEGFQALASLIDAAIWVWVAAWCGWIEEAKRIVKEIKDDFLAALDNGPQALWDLGKSLWDLLMNLLDLVIKVGDALIDFLKTIGSFIDYAAEIFGGSMSDMAKT
ncbi:hypothetical protein [Flindersiella endophytica]